MKSVPDLNALKVLLFDCQEDYPQDFIRTLRQLDIFNVQVARSFEETITLHNRLNLDIFFIDEDISCSSKTSLEIADSIRKLDAAVPIIFIGSTDNSPLRQEIERFSPCYFVKRELSKRRLAPAIKFARQQLETVTINNLVKARTAKDDLLEDESLHNKEQLFFKIGDSYKRIGQEKIDFFYAESKLTYARVDNRNYPTSVQLKVLERELAFNFLRCHKKFLINVNSIDSILPKEGKVKIKNEMIPIGYAYRKPFFERLNIFK